jgi:hypothetical protein
MKVEAMNPSGAFVVPNPNYYPFTYCPLSSSCRLARDEGVKRILQYYTEGPSFESAGLALEEHSE